jgi:hypothetical protein
MAPTLPLTSVDKALAAVAALAAKSTKLSAAEKKELKALAAKSVKPGKQGLTMADRAHCCWLIRKAGPESLPNVKVPPGIKRRLHLPEGSENGQHVPPSIKPAPAQDPLDRLEKLVPLRGKILSDAQFDDQRARILADPTIGTFGTADGIDPLDRIGKVAQLESSGTITAQQSARVTEQILSAA